MTTHDDHTFRELTPNDIDAVGGGSSIGLLILAGVAIIGLLAVAAARAGNRGNEPAVPPIL